MTTVNAAAPDAAITRALGDLITTLVWPGLPVVRGMVDRVPPPPGRQYAVITPLMAQPNGTTLHGYARPESVADTGAQEVRQRMTRRVQVDFYGANADAMCATLVALVNDARGVEFCAPYGVTPLYTGAAQAMPEPDGRENWTNRWTVDCFVQFDAAVTLEQEYFATVNLTTRLANAAAQEA